MNTESKEIESIEISTKETGSVETLSIYTGMNEVFAVTRKIIDGMENGDKLTVRDLTDKVSAQVNMTYANVMNLVQMFLKECKDVSVEIGRGGGVYKGGKKRRVDNRPRCSACNQVLRHEIKRFDTSATEN